MQLHQLKPRYKRALKKRIGRGGKKGTYSGRGIKGQRSRAGARLRPEVRGWIKRYPKLRGQGFRGPSGSRSKLTPRVINVGQLEQKFNAGDKVNPKILIQKRLIRPMKGNIPLVKILGNGKLTKSLVVEDCRFSHSGKEKIEKAGGRVVERLR